MPPRTRETGLQVSMTDDEEAIEVFDIRPRPEEEEEDVRPSPPPPSPPTVPKMPKRSERSIEDIEKLLAEISKPTDQLSNIQDVQKSIFKCLGLVN